MKRLVIVVIRIDLLFLFFLAVACEKLSVYNGQDSGRARDVLMSYYNDEVAVNEFTTKDNVFVFSFSDGSVVGFDIRSISIVSVDIFGFWQLNGERTDVVLENSGRELVPKGDDPRRLYGIVEGYTDWTFVFGGGNEIELKKTLFVSDPDSIIRGVNHRGFCTEAPENTLPAYRLSRLRGFQYVETDIQFTADNVPVLIHDSTVDRTSNGTGDVKNMTWDELQRLDFGCRLFSEFAGTRLASLAEFLDLCCQIELRPYLELKTGSRQQIESIVRLVDEYSMKDKVVYVSFNPRFLQCVLEFDNTAEVGLLTSMMSSSVIHDALSLDTGQNRFFVNSSDYSDYAISLCRSAAIPLEIWTINSRSTILSLPSYISGVASDFLHAGRVLLER